MPQTKKQWDQGSKPRKNRPIRRVLILCEDEKNSRDYFAAFPHDRDLVGVECVGTGMNTDGLMEEAIRRAKSARKEHAPYERIWVVFDRDDFPAQKFNRALALARSHNEIAPCWSNECFELWYLLHFDYRDTPIGRKDLKSKLGKLLGRKYDKSDTSLYEALKEKIDTALKHAKRLAFENRKSSTPTRNPSTRVHQLVESLRALGDLQTFRS